MYKCITYKPIAYLLAILGIHETIMVMSLIYRYGMLKPNLWVFALVNSTVQPPSTQPSWANGPGSVARDSTRNFGRWVAARFSGISADQGWKKHGWFVQKDPTHIITPGRWAPGWFTPSVYEGVPFFVGFWGSLEYLPRVCGQNHWFVDVTRWTPTAHDRCKCRYIWVTGLISLLIWVITPVIPGSGAHLVIWSSFRYLFLDFSPRKFGKSWNHSHVEEYFF